MAVVGYRVMGIGSVINPWLSFNCFGKADCRSMILNSLHFEVLELVFLPKLRILVCNRNIKN